MRETEIDRVFGINARFVRIINASRDVLVHFVKKNTSGTGILIDNTVAITIIKINNIVAILLKEIPFRILHEKKKYSFLTDRLKQKNIPFQ